MVSSKIFWFIKFEKINNIFLDIFSTEPSMQLCTPKKQIKPSVPQGKSNTSQQNTSSTKTTTIASSSVVSKANTPACKTKTQCNRSTPKVSGAQNKKATPKGTSVRKKTVANAMVTPVKPAVKKSVGSARKPPVPATPENSKFGKMGYLGSKGMSPGTPAIKKRNSKGETPLHVACIKV